MARISGVELPSEKRTDIGLTYIYGIGRANVIQLLEASKVDPAKRIKDLTEEEVGKLQKALEKFTVEGDLQREISVNIRGDWGLSGYSSPQRIAFSWAKNQVKC